LMVLANIFSLKLHRHELKNIPSFQYFFNRKVFVEK
jgi:hypothetical protein